MHTDKRRVVITGMGTLTPVGTGIDVFWDSLIKGKSGVGPITQFDPSGYTTRIAAEVKGFDPMEYMDRKHSKRMDRFAQFAVAAAGMALQDSGLDISEINCDRIGVVVGSGIGGIKTLEEQARLFLERGPGKVSPFLIPMMIPDMAAGQISIIYGLKGHNSCCVTACASGTNAIGDAFRLVQRGDADVMITGGTEASITPLSMAGFGAAKTLSSRNDDPTGASRPFELTRDGFVMGEGAGILIIEELNVAKARGAHIYAEIIGYGASGDAHHITSPAPGGEGAARAMKAALSDAGLSPKDIDYINAHGTSTEYNDVFETEAIKRVFGDWAYQIPISSIKSMIGHLLGAAGGVEAIASALTIHRNMIPPTINLHTPDPKCDLDYVPNAAREKEVNTVMSNSFGFGGHNSVIILKKYLD